MLPTMTLGQEVIEDYLSLCLSLCAHPLELLRPRLPESPPHGRLAQATGRIAATVREMIYLGSAIRHEITLADGTVVSARTGTEDEHFAVGLQVEIAGRPANGILLPDDGLSITI